MSASFYNLVDIFGINIGLRYLNEEQYKTKFGAFATILIVSFIVIQIIYVGSELVLKEKPDVIFSERYVEKPARYDFKPETYNFAFGAQFPGNYTHFIDPSIYTISVEQVAMKKEYNEETKQYDQKWSSIPIPYHHCTESDFKVKSSYEYFTKLPGYENMYCLDQSYTDLFIEGNFDQDSYGTITIQFKLCDPKTSTVKCRDDIDQILTNSFIAIYFNDLIVNPKDYYPFQTIGRDAFWNASPEYPKDATMYYRNIYVESDKGILFEDKNFERSTAISYQDQQIIFGESSYYFQIHIRFEKSKETVYHRKYKKIDSLLAEIGGVAKALMIIGILMFQPINKLNLHKTLANSLFTFHKEEDKLEENTNQKRGKLTELIEDHRRKTILTNQINTLATTRKLNEEIRDDDDVFKQDSNRRNKIENDSKKQPDFFNNHLNSNTQTKVSFPLFLDGQESSQNDRFKENLNTPHPLLSNELSQQQYQQQQFFINPNKTTNQNGVKNSVNLLEIIKQRNRLVESTKMNQEQRQQQNHDKQQPKLNDHSKQLQNRVLSRSNSVRQSVKNVFKEEKPNEKLDLNWSDYIKYYIWPFGRFQKKKQQIDYSIETIYQHLDILYIVKKLLELEKLKQLLLNEDQIKLIQFFPKPYIDVNQIQSNRKNTHTKKNKNASKNHEVNLLNNDNDKSEKQKAVEAFKALKNIISKPILSEIDKKIIEMLDSSILEDIENNEDLLKELKESIEIDGNHDNNIIDGNKLDLPCQTGERNLTQYQENPILEISGTQSIQVQRVQLPPQIALQNEGRNKNEKSLQELERFGKRTGNNEEDGKTNNKYLINNKQSSPQRLEQDNKNSFKFDVNNKTQVVSNYNEQISSVNLPITNVNQVKLDSQLDKEQQVNNIINNYNQDIIKFEENESNYSD